MLRAKKCVKIALASFLLILYHGNGPVDRDNRPGINVDSLGNFLNKSESVALRH